MQIPKNVWEQLIRHFRCELPREGVGVLTGTPAGVHYLKLQNTAQNEAHFRVSPQEWVSLLHALEEGNERLLAIVHSHPSTPAEPSSEDLEGFSYPDAYMLIVSLQHPHAPEAGLYKKTGQRIERCPFEII
ncbi:Mov34/MPN/PAD-1 family protein [Effusibacillus consociatus]|uniref:Mov34/MPN/PAD-1 family protein n=1 Tax=Effusibacillus consociatus TaxID=1117041 RepID=A0ABV9Q742_9BACL